MFDRLYISLIHPTKIGLFIKDKLWVPFAYILSFFVIVLGMLAFKGFQTDYFNPSPSKQIVPMIIDNKNTYNVSFIDGKLQGESIRIETTDYVAYFNVSSPQIVAATPTFMFHEKNVVVYYLFESSTFTYEELKFDGSFNFTNIKNKNADDIFQFSMLVDKICVNFNVKYQKAALITDAIYVIFYMAITFGAVILFSFFTNPVIKMGFRAKLCLYDTLICFIFISLSIAFSTNWLIYIGLILAAMYARFTFSRIIQVKVRRN